MVTVPFSLREDYWDDFILQDEDIEFLYNYLLEQETPLTPKELAAALVEERIRREKADLEQQRLASGTIYQPKGDYQAGQRLLFPAMSWQNGEVVSVREGRNPDLGEFQVIQVEFGDGEKHEFATRLKTHLLNEPVKLTLDDDSLDAQKVLKEYGEDLIERVELGLREKPDFVRIAGRWFPRALLVDVNAGHLNLAEAVLDMAGGGPLPTSELLEQIELHPSGVDPKLVDFSVDLALQEDPRFDEVGPAGKVLWFLQRLEPPQVLEPPLYLKYAGIEYDRSLLTKEMLNLERELDDELSPVQTKHQNLDEVEIRLIFPHWRSGTLPLSARVRHLFPTAYETPRIRFILVDGETGEKIPAWVVREKRYVCGLAEWYKTRNLMPGSLIVVRRGREPGEVIIQARTRRSTREWIKTVLVGSDGGIVFALLKQVVSAAYDERLSIAVPDAEGLDAAWLQKDSHSLERVVINMVKELAKLNPQSHVHASELYAAVNVIRRCPPGPLLALLASRPGFVHVGDLHYRLVDS